MQSELPVVVIGAGPVGLAAAAHLSERGVPAMVLEAGGSAGEAVLRWGHVRLFSPWRYVVDRAAQRILERAGWVHPDPDAFPTGHELVARYLLPLASTNALRPMLRLDSRVLSVARAGFDKAKTRGREQAPFVLRMSSPRGEETLLARAVIDASGTTQTPNPLGASGVPAQGERAMADLVHYGIPDVRGAQRGRYQDKRVLVVGSGHSAFNAVLELLRRDGPSAETLWAIRREQPGALFGGGEKDALAERARLGTRMREAVASGRVKLLTGFAVTALERSAGGVEVVAADGRRVEVDEVVATTGFRPDLELTRELRLAVDPIIESPVALAPLIDPNEHSCGTVPPHGARELSHPESGYYAVGMKSYGRAPTFLMLTGYEQVRSVVAALAGDRLASERVELVLPETGVCSADAQCDVTCCAAPAPAALELR